MAEKTIGSRLLDLKARSGLSLPKIAKSGGYKNASSIQRYFDEAYDPAMLPGKVAARLIEALVGFGDPPIQRQDIVALTDIGFMFDRKFSPDAGVVPDFRRAKSPEIYCKPTVKTPASESPGGPEMEGMVIAEDDPVRVFKKPAHLLYRAIDAIFVSVRTMSPRYAVGEIIYFEHERPAAAGQDVVIYLAQADPGPGMPLVILCRLIDESDATYEVATLTPASRFSIPRGIVEIIAPVLTFSDMLEPTVIRS